MIEAVAYNTIVIIGGDSEEREAARECLSRVVEWCPKMLPLAKGIFARLLVVRQLRRFIREENVDINKTVFHVFGFGVCAEALVSLSKRMPLRWICTVRGGELYRMKGGSYRKFIESAEMVYCVGESATNFLRVKYKDLSHKIATRKLGACQMRGLPCHKKDDKKLTFLSCDGDDASLRNQRLMLAARLLAALARGRTSTEVKWIHRRRGERGGRVKRVEREERGKRGEFEALKLSMEKMNLPSNFKYEFIDAERRVSEPVDWYVSMDAAADSLLETVGWALSAGLPVVSSEIVANASGLDDDCALILSQNPAEEEFVRGILPYLENESRYQAMRSGARKHWEEECDSTKLRREFYERF